jgi:calcium/calmodulin-dependent protein kinase I
MNEIYDTPTHYYMICDLVSGKDLFDYLAERNYSLPETRACELIAQLADALQYLRAFGVVHRDLKLENIMMSDNSDTALPLLIDFGLARILYPGQTTTEPFGTLGYVGPEVLRKDEYSFSCDIWSLGCITYAILCGSLPFDHNEAKKTIEYTKEMPVAFELPQWRRVSQEGKNFVQECLNKDHKKRINLA